MHDVLHCVYVRDVESSFLRLDAGPHDAETHDIEAPEREVREVLGVEHIGRHPRDILLYRVRAVEEQPAAERVHEEAVRVHTDRAVERRRRPRALGG